MTLSMNAIIDSRILAARAEDENVKRQISSLRQQRREIQIQIATLESLRGELNESAIAPATNNGHQPENHNDLSVKGLKATPAILRLLREKPNLKLPEIIDTLEDQIATTSSKKRHIIRTCVGQLLGVKITKDESGKYSLMN